MALHLLYVAVLLSVLTLFLATSDAVLNCSTTAGNNSSTFTVDPRRKSQNNVYQTPSPSSSPPRSNNHAPFVPAGNQQGSGFNTKSSSTTVVAGSITAAIAVVAGVVVLLVCFMRKRARFNHHRLNRKTETLIEMTMEEEVHNTRRFSYAHLLAATENFSDSRKIGQGAFGAVYKAQLMNWTTPVAVKRTMRVADHERAARDYDNEIKVISKLSHPNLVPFVGSCDENGELLLVYDLIHNGTLDYHLHYANTILSWSRRYKIALGMASALNYMHGNHPRVLHRDIKPGNVMLDEEFNAKVGDFGLVRQVPIDKTSCPMTIFGSSRYIDPQYCSTGCISPESDIYSFGVVLLEIASGEIPQCLKGNGLVEKFRRLYYSNSLLDAVDRRLNDDFDEEQMKRVILIGLLCVQFDHHMRPSSKEVLGYLEGRLPVPQLHIKTCKQAK
uniref:Protein kinase domain-containing protein n=1 Tax=Oryza glumipatula TaxID=40148 RepID=A0A0D9ZW03_9ORYZ